MRAGVLIGAVAAAFLVLPVAGAAACDPLDPSACLYPWPNDHFTRADPTSPTGKRLALQDDWMPKNRFGKPVSAAPYDWNDGFSPGNMIVTKVPGLDTPEASPEVRVPAARRRADRRVRRPALRALTT